ncbi:MAG: FtsQ-type POTRA domain-containing protein [Anaerolineae bacterium]|nr:FtsQ-type POTRA domain-containing protein [Anaerolineae bacterium]MDK1080554.1 FtsQ-type POTRA domain-containing protein [Anaerolineae bacterium]MDK1117429.1 FtsQ-type POTRA domain-containing protein [Anaerolineae bacterium]
MSQRKKLTRSETLRKRRLAQKQFDPRQQKRKSRSKSKHSSHQLPPITTRGVLNDAALDHHRKARARNRRYNAVFSRPHIKIRLLPRLKFHFGWRPLSFLLVIFFGAGLYLAWMRPEFRVNTAQVKGNHRISADEINSVLGLNGFPIFMLTPDQIEVQTLRNYPELATVEVRVSLPNLVTVNVTERQPIILWQQAGGYTWIDESGIAFQPRGEVSGLITVQALGEPPAMALVVEDRVTPTPFIPENIVNSLIALAPHIPLGTTILYDPLSGLSWTDGRGWQAVFGHSDIDVDDKVLIYKAMVTWLSNRGIRPTLINVAYPSAPYYRLEQLKAEEQ